MDVFVEQMVVKKKTGKDLARTAACSLGGAVALCLILDLADARSGQCQLRCGKGSCTAGDGN